MHILFLTDNFPPEVNAPASRTFEHCREWVRAGHNVTVITGAPNFPAGKVYDGYRNRWRCRETMDGIEVIRVWTYITANEGFARRILDYASFMISAIPAAISVREVDVIVATSPQLFTPCAAWVASVIKRRPYVFELRDLWPESIRAVGAIKTSRILDALEALELFLYRRAAHIVSVTHSFKDNLISRGIDGDKISVVTNGVDLSRFQPTPRGKQLAHKLGLDGKFVVAYVGTHGMAHALKTLLRAAERLQNEPRARDVRLVLLGNGAEKTELQDWAKQRGLSNVLFLESVPKHEVVQYWSLVDISVIHLKRASLFETVIPSKIFECMALGIPILHGVAGESARLIERERAGITFEPENDAKLTSLILELLEQPERLKELSQRGRAAAARYDRATLATDMLATLEHVEEQKELRSPIEKKVS